MNVNSNIRASAAARQSQSVPTTRASQLFTDNELSQARLFAQLPRTAGAVEDYLSKYAARGNLDAALSAILRSAKATLSRNAARSARMH